MQTVIDRVLVAGMAKAEKELQPPSKSRVVKEWKELVDFSRLEADLHRAMTKPGLTKKQCNRLHELMDKVEYVVCSSRLEIYEIAGG